MHVPCLLPSLKILGQRKGRRGYVDDAEGANTVNNQKNKHVVSQPDSNCPANARSSMLI
jgi:hypothetical protein